VDGLACELRREDYVTTPHDIIEMLPDGVRAEVIEGEVIVNAATPAGRHAKIVLAVRRAFARHGIDNLYENTTLAVEHDEAEYVPDLARWPEYLIEGDSWEFPAEECTFALEVVSGDRPGRRRREYDKASGYARGGVPVLLLIDPVEGICKMFTEPKAGDYSVRQIVKFGEPLFIPAPEGVVELRTEGLLSAILILGPLGGEVRRLVITDTPFTPRYCAPRVT
jgi:hypothetical protein